jgi:hypothetical protein
VTDFLFGLVGRLPTLRKRKNPGLAGLIGLIAGGIGLGLYFWSWTDVFIPIVLAVLAGAAVQGFAHTDAVEAGAIVAGLYGIVRACASNAALTKTGLGDQEAEHEKGETHR